ncbi:MAG: response regulator [Xenococcaceae cyanobacterium MO_207.B15]|nr:response regulator [Xenococcaceae cyanobacterium MO_207.B15]MDJ0746776.1 response regulator [Xenococcaceae cyanobacterium MO_167.B27]
MKFLVVDDSSVDRRFIVSMLEKMGHQADACRDTTDVLEKVAKENYAAVILDIVMPEQDGFKFLRKLRTNPATAKQYVIFCSSKKTPVEINYGIKRAGANDYITKPVTPESLEEALQKV